MEAMGLALNRTVNNVHDVLEEVLGAGIDNERRREQVPVVLEGGEVPGFRLEYTEGRRDSKCWEVEGRRTELARQTRGQGECKHAISIDRDDAAVGCSQWGCTTYDDLLDDHFESTKPIAPDIVAMPDKATCAAANIILGDDSPMESLAEEVIRAVSGSGGEWCRGGCL